MARSKRAPDILSSSLFADATRHLPRNYGVWCLVTKRWKTCCLNRIEADAETARRNAEHPHSKEPWFETRPYEPPSVEE